MLYDHYYKKFLIENPYIRKLKNFDPSQSSSLIYRNEKGKELINFSSSDYLGLSKHPLLIQRSQEYAKKWGVGSGSSRLVTGNFCFYEDLEKKLANVLQKPAALILGSGYQTNISVLEALLDKEILKEEPLVFCDKYCHVSMLSTSRYLTQLKRFQHNDLHHLKILLEKYAYSKQPKFILIESLYSMEGDFADLPAIIELANQHQAFLYVDDAHAVGVYGWGRTVEHAHSIPFIMGTFSKGLGSYGGYIACSETLRNYLIQKCKGLIYSTALSPAILGAISAAIDLVPHLNPERERIFVNAERLRHFFKENHLDYGQSHSHIIPWIIGDASKTLAVAKKLEEMGVLGVAIQPPSVPTGKSRIRFCITALHTEKEIEYLMNTILFIHTHQKQKMVKYFNQGAKTYDTYSNLQKKIANCLVHKIPKKSPQHILEIGCGTGILSQPLISLFPKASFLLTDISPEMVKTCSKKLNHYPGIQFQCMDGERITQEKKYDLIISSMSLHWFEYFQQGLNHLIHQLNPGGSLIFAIPGDDSLKEWSEICQASQLPVGTRIFPNESVIMADFPEMKLAVEIFQQDYPNAYAFLHSLKSLGVRMPHSNHTPIPSGQLRRLLKQYSKPIQITYKIIFGQYTRSV